MGQKPYILPVIIISQFACTSMWFAGNAIVDQLTLKTGMGPEIIGYVLSSVQLGFITGTLTFALLMIPDRFSPSKVFMVCAFLAAICNTVLLSEHITSWLLLSVRFGTGFFLAGIYPVGMKIAADYYEKGLGKALGFLVGALVLGSGLPYFIGALSLGSSYSWVVKITSLISILGGVILWLLVPNGPFRKPSSRLQLAAGPALFKISGFKKGALGYFGHMWELYAFWAFTPLAALTFNSMHDETLSVPLFTGVIFALGGLACGLGGVCSLKVGSRRVATVALMISGLFCITSPLLFHLPRLAFMGGWCLWGMAVTADSPQFSSLIANAIPAELKGTGLTLVNCLGFSISIISIQLVSLMIETINPIYIFQILAIGPLLGLIGLLKKSKS